MSAEKAIERDLKRFDDLTAQFERTALVLGFVNLFAAAWGRAPGFQMNPSSVGLSITGFNVGYAIVYGPLLAVITLMVYRGLIQRREMMRKAIMHQVGTKSDGQTALSEGDRLQLQGFANKTLDVAPSRADRLWRLTWYFLVPPAAACVLTLRFFDFIPSDQSAKAWDRWERARFLLFGTGGWEIRPILPAHDLEKAKDLMNQLPYIYAPLESWAEIGCCIAAVILAWRSARSYFAPSVGKDGADALAG